MGLQEYLNTEEEKHKQTIDSYKKWSGLPFKSLAHVDCDKMILFAEHYHQEQLALLRVSQQRELLIGFALKVHRELHFIDSKSPVSMVDEYLANL